MDKKKVVVIDDEKDLCLLIKSILMSTGEYDIVTALDGTEGLKAIAQHKPNVIFLDFVMPKTSGDKVLAALKQDPELSKIPVILMSGLGEMLYKGKDQWRWLPNNPAARQRGPIPEVLADKKKAEAVPGALGVKAYLHKPFTREILLETVTDVLKAPPPAEEKPQTEM